MTVRRKLSRLARCALATLIVASALTACAARPDIGVIDRYRERAAARANFVRSLDEYEDPTLKMYLAGVLARLVDAAGGQQPTIRVLDSSYPNGFAGGKNNILITRGLLAMLDDEAELAFVLGHELAHLEQRRKSRGSMPRSPLGRGEASAAASLSSALMAREVAADARSAELLRLAGYDGDAPRRALHRLYFRRESEVAPAFVRSHPTSVERVAALPKTAGGEAGAERFRKAVDGLPFVFALSHYQRQGRRILAPYLDLTMTLPIGFQLTKTRGTRATLEDHDGSTRIVVSPMKAPRETAEHFLRKRFAPALDKAFSVGATRDVRRYSPSEASEGASALMSVKGDDEVLELSVAVLNVDGLWIVRMVAYPIEKREQARRVAEAFDRQLRRTPVNERSRIRFVVYRSSDDLRTMAESFGPGAEGDDVFRRVNGLEKAETPKPGRILKVLETGPK